MHSTRPAGAPVCRSEEDVRLAGVSPGFRVAVRAIGDAYSRYPPGEVLNEFTIVTP